MLASGRYRINTNPVVLRCEVSKMASISNGKIPSVKCWFTGLFGVGLGLLFPGAMAQVHYGYAQAPSGQSSPTAAKPSGTVTEWSDPSGRSPSTRTVEKHAESGGTAVTTRSS